MLILQYVNDLRVSSDEESQVLSNINEFRDLLREYEVKMIIT